MGRGFPCVTLKLCNEEQFGVKEKERRNGGNCGSLHISIAFLTKDSNIHTKDLGNRVSEIPTVGFILKAPLNSQLYHHSSYLDRIIVLTKCLLRLTDHLGLFAQLIVTWQVCLPPSPKNFENMGGGERQRYWHSWLSLLPSKIKTVFLKNARAIKTKPTKK